MANTRKGAPQNDRLGSQVKVITIDWATVAAKTDLTASPILVLCTLPQEAIITSFTYYTPQPMTPPALGNVSLVRLRDTFNTVTAVFGVVQLSKPTASPAAVIATAGMPALFTGGAQLALAMPALPAPVPPASFAGITEIVVTYSLPSQLSGYATPEAL